MFLELSCLFGYQRVSSLLLLLEKGFGCSSLVCIMKFAGSFILRWFVFLFGFDSCQHLAGIFNLLFLLFFHNFFLTLS